MMFTVKFAAQEQFGNGQAKDRSFKKPKQNSVDFPTMTAALEYCNKACNIQKVEENGGRLLFATVPGTDDPRDFAYKDALLLGDFAHKDALLLALLWESEDDIQDGDTFFAAFAIYES